jgi:hypothetical protein
MLASPISILSSSGHLPYRHYHLKVILHIDTVILRSSYISTLSSKGHLPYRHCQLKISIHIDADIKDRMTGRMLSLCRGGLRRRSTCCNPGAARTADDGEQSVALFRKAADFEDVEAQLALVGAYYSGKSEQGPVK